MSEYSHPQDSILAGTILQSKLFQPARQANRVDRERLVSRLNAGLQSARPLTLISAPAGYGKSTLVTEWLAQVERPVAWLSLDESDDDPLRFFFYLMAALGGAGVVLEENLSTAFRVGQLPPREVLTASLGNAVLAAGLYPVCVLDDFQNIQDQYILDVLRALILHQSGHFHLVLVTREDPALPLPRLRAGNLLTEIRAGDLRFDEAEVREFFQVCMGFELRQEDLAQLSERTEGWVAGLQLAGLSMQGRQDLPAFIRSLRGSQRFFLNYLTEEVLKSQQPDVQEFLLLTSVLNQLNGELCDALTGRSDSAARLETLLASNLFIVPLDEESNWYRYHHLFSDLLRNQLRNQYPQRMASLALAASEWYEKRGGVLEAIEYALDGQDFQRAVGLIEKSAWGLLNHGYVRHLEKLIQSLPLDARLNSPRASLGLAWMHLLRGNIAQTTVYLEQAQSSIANAGPDNPQRRALSAEALALRSNMMQVQGKVGEALEAGNQALALVDPNNLRDVGLINLGLGGAYRQAGDFEQAVAALQNAYNSSYQANELVTGMLAISHLTLMSLQYGRLQFAADAAKRAMDWMERGGGAPPPIMGAVLGALGRIYYEWDQISTARDLLLKGIQLSTFSGHNASLIYIKSSLVQLHVSSGELDAANKELTSAFEIQAQGAPGWVYPDLLARQAEFLSMQGNFVGAEAILNKSGVVVSAEVTHRTDPLHLAWLYLLKAKKDPAAINLAERIVASAQAGQRRGTALHALVMGALCQGTDSAAALDWLGQALALAEPEGYLRVFIDEGAAMAALLSRINTSAYARMLLEHFPQGSQGPEKLATPGVPALTARELEILQLLSAGMTYDEVASHLVVSVNTVRYHIKSVYGKLGVAKLAGAVERARDLGILK